MKAAAERMCLMPMNPKLKFLSAAIIASFALAATGQETEEFDPGGWAIVGTPKYISAVEGEVVVWSHRIHPKVFASKAACEEGIEVKLADHPSDYSFELKCSYPHPSLVPIQTLALSSDEPDDLGTIGESD